MNKPSPSPTKRPRRAQPLQPDNPLRRDGRDDAPKPQNDRDAKADADRAREQADAALSNVRDVPPTSLIARAARLRVLPHEWPRDMGTTLTPTNHAMQATPVPPPIPPEAPPSQPNVVPTPPPAPSPPPLPPEIKDPPAPTPTAPVNDPQPSEQRG